MRRLVWIVLGLALAVSLLGPAGGAEATGPAPVPVPTVAPASPPPLAAASGTVEAAATRKKAKVKLPKRCRTKGRVLCADKTKRKLYYVKKGKIIKTMDARFGCRGMATRQGTFHVYRKNRHWTSTIYHTKMPYSMFFSGGQAVHYSADFKRRGYAGCSHGCVNIRSWSKLRYVFHHVKVGDRVVVYRS